MLTTEAFNALLKTLEEPPPHTVIVLATTEAHRIPATVVSRCQRFDFRRVAHGPAVSRLAHICSQEGLVVSREALGALVKAAAGSLRDAQNLLDQTVARYGTEVSLEQVQATLGVTGDRRVDRFAGQALRHELQAGLQTLHEVVEDGVDLRQFGRELVDYLRGVLLVKVGVPDQLEIEAEVLAEMKRLGAAVDLGETVRALRTFSQVDPRTDWLSPLPLELGLVDLALGEAEAAVTPPAEREGVARGTRETPPAAVQSPMVSPPIDRVPEKAAAPADTPVRPAQPAAVPPTVAAAGPPEEAEPVPAVPGPEGEDQLAAQWPRVLEALHATNKTIEALLRSCEPRLGDGVVVLDFFYPYHREKMDDARYRRVLEEVLARIMGQKYSVQCTFTPRDKRAKLLTAASDPLIKAAQEILGARIVDVE